ncbi:cob(I)yrinic acid a,c-diamide adenosyltransferase [Clostridium sp.]|uniref:cob(I)yrinic acid a,c-diamide adenosyltransferase n=1 Tax=Clostridium sp. TaxID=1506 RepID=UPI00263345E7|nr:cob(I)yrinic acid a,c-diamide adenosyltransferase [Clostridium sp.]
MGKLKNGYVQVYTGNGKGKTTAAVGLAVRAAGNKYTVYMVQFLKGNEFGEVKIAKKLAPFFNIYRFEKKRGFFWTLNDEEKVELKEEVQKAFEFCKESLKQEKCDILIMDEIMGVLSNELISEEQLLELIDIKPSNIELVLTGRNAPKSIIDKANLVTDMKDIKHYFNNGVTSREGIEF